MSTRESGNKEKGRMIFLRDGQSFASDMKVEMVRIVENINSEKPKSEAQRAIVVNFQETCNVIMIMVEPDEDIATVCRQVSLDIDEGYGTKLADVIEDVVESRIQAALKNLEAKLSSPKSILKGALPAPGDISKRKVGFTEE